MQHFHDDEKRSNDGISTILNNPVHVDVYSIGNNKYLDCFTLLPAVALRVNQNTSFTA